jgi:hypothetical protein
MFPTQNFMAKSETDSYVQTDTLANMTKLTGAFCDYANALKMALALRGRAHLAHSFTE